MRSLVETYARAKSRADVAGAMAVCGEGFVLDTPSFGVASRNREETVGHLHAFFHAFPDYGVHVEQRDLRARRRRRLGHGAHDPRGNFLDLAATNRTAEVPFCSAFTFAGDRLASERFFIDLCDALRRRSASRSATCGGAGADSRRGLRT